MALSERSRSTIYQSFSELIGDDVAVEEMLSNFPSRDAEEPASKEFLRAEMSDLRLDLRTEMGDLRTELRTDMAAFRAAFHTELHTEIRRSTQLTITMMFAFNAALATVIALVT